MAVNLKKRLRVLEQAVDTSDDDRCEACGCEPGSELKFEVSFSDDEEIDGPDVCPGCGRPLILRLSFDEPLRSGR